MDSDVVVKYTRLFSKFTREMLEDFIVNSHKDSEAILMVGGDNYGQAQAKKDLASTKDEILELMDAIQDNDNSPIDVHIGNIKDEAVDVAVCAMLVYRSAARLAEIRNHEKREKDNETQ